MERPRLVLRQPANLGSYVVHTRCLRAAQRQTPFDWEDDAGRLLGSAGMACSAAPLACSGARACVRACRVHAPLPEAF